MPEESGGFPFVLLGVGLVLLVGLGGGVALLLRRRQPRRPAPASAPAFPAEAPASGPAAAPVSGPEVAPLTGPAAAPPPAVPTQQERTSAGFTAVPRPPADGVTAPLPGAVAVEPTADANGTPEAHAFCTCCGTKAASGQRFCGGCGAAL